MDVLTQLQAKWQEDGEHVIETSEQIVQEVQGRLLSNLKGDVSDEVFDKAFRHYEQLFDPQYGGFGARRNFRPRTIYRFCCDTTSVPERIKRCKS